MNRDSNQAISLLPFEIKDPVTINQVQYQNYVTQTEVGWSNCQTELEWLCKLNYLAEGLAAKKINQEKFLELEETLVVNWWKKTALKQD